MNAYIATKFENVSEFKNISKRLKDELNIDTVLDWTKHTKCKPFSENSELSKTQAEEDIEGIRTCHIFIMYYDGTNKGSGMFLELGYALALLDMGLKYEVFAYGPNIKDTSMFVHLDTITTYETLDEIINHIKDEV